MTMHDEAAKGTQRNEFSIDVNNAGMYFPGKACKVKEGPGQLSLENSKVMEL